MPVCDAVILVALGRGSDGRGDYVEHWPTNHQICRTKLDLLDRLGVHDLGLLVELGSFAYVETQVLRQVEKEASLVAACAVVSLPLVTRVPTDNVSLVRVVAALRLHLH